MAEPDRSRRFRSGVMIEPQLPASAISRAGLLLSRFCRCSMGRVDAARSQSQADRLNRPTQLLDPWKLRPNKVAGGPETELDGMVRDISESGCSLLPVEESTRFFGICVAQ